MTDELTPEEREQFNQLPRERMPAGLEGRVVAALRDEGVLAKPHRLVLVTRSRVAGLLAACVALVIGAYSIGLQRGDTRALLPATQAPAPATALEEPLRMTETEAVTKPDPEPEVRPLKKKGADVSVVPPASEAVKEEPAADVALEKSVETKREEAAAPAPTEPVESEVATTEAAPQRSERDGAAEALARQAESPKASLRADAPTSGFQPLYKMNSAPRAKPPITIWLDGVQFSIEADSVRVVRDERGRLLLIYTPEGIKRIRLSDAP